MSLLTVRQAAERLGIGYSTLKHWIYEGRVRTRVTSGGHHRIVDAEVDRLLAPAAGAAARKTHRARSGVIVAISGRNQLRGYVDEVRVEGLLAQVRLRIGDQTLTAVITRDVTQLVEDAEGIAALEHPLQSGCSLLFGEDCELMLRLLASDALFRRRHGRSFLR